MTNPPPRPALISTKSGVRPAVDRLTPLTPLTPLPGIVPMSGKLRDKGPKPVKPGSAEKPQKPEKQVELVVTMPAAMRKRLKAKAEALGYTPEEATYRLLRSWLES